MIDIVKKYLYEDIYKNSREYNTYKTFLGFNFFGSKKIIIWNDIPHFQIFVMNKFWIYPLFFLDFIRKILLCFKMVFAYFRSIYFFFFKIKARYFKYICSYPLCRKEGELVYKSKEISFGLFEIFKCMNYLFIKKTNYYEDLNKIPPYKQIGYYKYFLNAKKISNKSYFKKAFREIFYLFFVFKNCNLLFNINNFDKQSLLLTIKYFGLGKSFFKG